MKPFGYLAVSILVMVLTVGRADAQRGQISLKDGKSLLETCENAVDVADGKLFTEHVPIRQPMDWASAMTCSGYLQGVIDLNAGYRTHAGASETVRPLFCIPANGLEIGQAARVVARFLRNHPERLTQDAIALTVDALRDSFPCGAGR